jgi:hypothetical protein
MAMNIDDIQIDPVEHQLLAQAKQMLDDETQHLNYKTIMGLEKSRQQALLKTSKTFNDSHLNADGSISMKKYLPGSLVVISLLLALTFYTLKNDQSAEDNPLKLYSDLELLGAKEPLEFYENLEFYEWLEINE